MEQENKLIKQANTSKDLSTISTSDTTVDLLKKNQFEQLAKSVSNKIADLLTAEPIRSLISNAGREAIQTYLEVEIIKLAGNVNVNPALNIKTHQVPVIAEMLIDQYPLESIEDFTLCFRRATVGLYGEIYRIDGAIINQWFAKYLDEKYDALEQKLAKEKHADKQAEKLTQGKSDEAVDGSKYFKQILENIGAPTHEKTARQETEYQIFKTEYLRKKKEEEQQQQQKENDHGRSEQSNSSGPDRQSTGTENV
jgi:hypothetical protein